MKSRLGTALLVGVLLGDCCGQEASSPTKVNTDTPGLNAKSAEVEPADSGSTATLNGITNVIEQAQAGDAAAIAQLRHQAENGGADAQFNLGLIHFHGRVVAKDEVEAVKWYRKAAEQGNIMAQYNLGICYSEGIGVAQDFTEAAKWYRKAAEHGYARAQHNFGVSYANGQGVTQDDVEAAKWFRKAAEQNVPEAQFNLGQFYSQGKSVAQDLAEAVKWFRKAAEQGFALAEYNLGSCYRNGIGVAKDEVEAVKWYRKAAEQGNTGAQARLADCYFHGKGVAKDEVESYKWVLLAGAQGNELARKAIQALEELITPSQRAEGQRLAREFRPRVEAVKAEQAPGIMPGLPTPKEPKGSGTGFLMTEDGYLVTSEHVVSDGRTLRVLTRGGVVNARVVKVDAANDLALLKVEGNYTPLPVVPSRTVKLGSTVATVGFPNIGLQGFAPKLAKGEIAALSGPQDDARFFQISAPVQPGNSGGALVDERGNVVGVVAAKLDAAAALKSSGSLPENVNYAVKSSYLLSFLEAVPEVAAKLKEPGTREVKFEDVVKAAEQAAVLVLVY